MTEVNEESNNKDKFPERMFQRADELHKSGIPVDQANSQAWLEERIKNWPSGWGDDLQIIIYGDFKHPEKEINIEPLEITIHPEKLEKTVVRSGLCQVKATVKIKEKDVSSLIEATRRINILLGAWILVEWGNCAVGWWSWITHDSGGGVIGNLNHIDILGAIDGILQLPQPIRQKVDAALFWLREPGNSILESYRTNVLRTYTAYWNAFECLIEAINISHPQPKLAKDKKQQSLDELVSSRQGELTVEDIEKFYHGIINPGFRGTAKHTLQECFPEEEAERYYFECFQTEDKKNQLYEIRNAINHGSVDAEDPNELIRIESRLHILWLLVWNIFGRIVPFSTPVSNPITNH